MLVGVLAVRDVTTVQGSDDQPLVQEATERRTSVLVLDRTALLADGVVEQAAALHSQGLRVCSLVDFYEERLGKLPASELERAWMLFDSEALHRFRRDWPKRLVDISAATLGLALLALVVPWVVVANAVGNRGPLLVRQKCVGRNGRRFELLRFRTLQHPGAAEVGGDRDVARVPTVGRILRATHLDVLPQAVNILSGDLSLVGPRPDQPLHVRRVSAELPYYDLRHRVRPGITGWAQVKCRGRGDERDFLEQLQYDFTYLRHRSLSFDAKVIARAVRRAPTTAGDRTAVGAPGSSGWRTAHVGPAPPTSFGSSRSRV